MLLRKLFLLLVSFLAVCFSGTAMAFEFTVPYRITNQDLEQYLSKKVKLNQSVGFNNFFTFDYEIKNMKPKIGENEGQIAISATIKGTLSLLQDKFESQIEIEFSAKPYYDSATGSIYLKDFHITKSNITPEKYMKDIEKLMPWLNNSLANLLEKTPIYQLDEEKFSQRIIKKFAKAIVVKPNQLEFKVGW